jgi:quinol monooxygenase YgiN
MDRLSRKEHQVASMFIKHRVADFAKWKPVFDDHEGTRRESGVTAHSVHRDADDPNVVIIAFRVGSIARAREFVASPDLEAAMERAGVVGPPEIWFTEDIEHKNY